MNYPSFSVCWYLTLNRGPVLLDVGVAGMRDPSAVKCLHCHYSHYLARPQHGNIIGQWVGEILSTGKFQDEVPEQESSTDA